MIYATRSPAAGRVLLVLVLSVFTGASLWFVGNAVIDDLAHAWGLPADALARLTSAIQLGFIAGTLVYAFFSIPDRYSPSKVYLFSAIAAALANLGVIAIDGNYSLWLMLRFVTGFFLAGVYPVGMKIAAGWYREELGKAIGFLVAALILGTAFPHLINSLSTRGFGPPADAYVYVTVATTVLAILGAVAVYRWVPDGPFLQQGASFNPRAFVLIFKSRSFRASAFGYFGHMWELYAFWAFVPIFLGSHFVLQDTRTVDISLLTFLVIGIGCIGSAVGGLWSRTLGSAPVAAFQLAVSGLCCLLSPLLLFAPTPVFLIFMLVWGLTVAGDSPQFSALNAATAPRLYVGTALTVANCIGFAITIVSIELVNLIATRLAPQYLLLVLALGPVFGLAFVRSLLFKKA